MKDTPISRRDFLKNMGIAGAGAFLAASPWLSAFSEVTNTSSEYLKREVPYGNYRSRFERTIFNEFPCEKSEGGYCSVVRYLSAFD